MTSGRAETGIPLTTGYDEFGTDERREQATRSRASVRASSRSARRRGSGANNALVTAELPAAVGAGSRSVVRPPRVRRRDPAPPPLRVAVWLLFFGLALAIGLLVVEHVRPNWLTLLRSNEPVNSTASPPAGATTLPHSHAQTMVLVSNTPTGATYSVPTANYSLVLYGDGRCYVEVHSPPSSSQLSTAEVVNLTTAPTAFPQHGASEIYMAAQASSLVVESGTKVYGTIKLPKLGPNFSYTFEPTTP